MSVLCHNFAFRNHKKILNLRFCPLMAVQMRYNRGTYNVLDLTHTISIEEKEVKTQTMSIRALDYSKNK